MLNITLSKSLGIKSLYTCLAEQQYTVGNTNWLLQPNMSNLRVYSCVTYNVNRGEAAQTVKLRIYAERAKLFALRTYYT